MLLRRLAIDTLVFAIEIAQLACDGHTDNSALTFLSVN